MPTFQTPEDVQGQQSNVFPESFSQPQAPVSPDYSQQKAVYAGIAQAPTGSTPDQLATAIDNTKNRIDNGEEQQVSQEIANQQQDASKPIQQDAIKNAIVNDNPVDFATLLHAYANPSVPTPAEVQIAPEKAAVDKMTDYAAQEDPVQAKVQEQITPDAFATANDMNARRALIANESTKLSNAFDSESLGAKALDSIGYTLGSMVLRGEYAATGNVGVSSHMPAFLVGNQIQAESRAIMNPDIPQDTFVNEVLPQYLAQTKAAATILNPNNSVARFLGLNGPITESNPLLQQQLLNNLLDLSDHKANVDNWIAAGDNIAAGGIGYSLFKSMTRTLATMGARISSTEAAATTMKFGGAGSTVPGGGASVVSRTSPLVSFINQNDALVDSMHSGFTPNFDLAGSNAPTAINDAIDRQETLANRVNEIQRSPFLSPEEQQSAIKDAVGQVNDRIASQDLAVADVHMVSQPNSATTDVGVKIGKTDGSGWATPENAIAAMERAGYSADDISTKGTGTLPTLNIIKRETPADSLGGVNTHFDINDSTGKPLAQVHGYIHGDTYNVGLIASKVNRSLTTAELKSINNGMRNQLPASIKNISGVRTTGARGRMSYDSDGNYRAGLLAKRVTSPLTIAKGIEGQHYPILRTSVAGNGLTAPANIDELQGGTLGVWKKYIQSTEVTDLPRLNELKQQADYTAGRLTENVLAPLMRSTNDLDSTSKQSLFKIINMNMDKGKYLSVDGLHQSHMEITGNPAPEKIMKAYYDLKQANDVTYALNNRLTYEDYAHNGYKDIDFHGNESIEPKLANTVRSKRIEILPSKGATRVYDASRGEMYPINKLDAEKLIQLKEQDYHLFQVEDTQIKGGPVTHILAKNSDYTQREISPYQVNYKPGTIGPRYYAGKWYLKQAETHAFEGGVKFRGKDKTLFNSQTRLELDNYAANFNKGLEAYKDFNDGKLTMQEAEEVLGKHTNFETVQDFKQAMDKGLFTEHPMQVVKDGERVKFGNSIVQELANANDLQDYTVRAQQQGELIHSARGERLTSPTGDITPVLNPQASVAKSAENAIKQYSFAAYNETAINTWYKTSRDLGVLKEPDAGAKYNFFDKDPYNKDVSFDQQSKLETMRMSIQRTIGQKVMSQKVISAVTEHIGTWVEGNLPANISQPIARRAYDLMSSNPFTALRALAFHRTLGMFNPSRLVIHVSTLVNAMAAHPIYGAKAFAAYLPTWLARTNGNASVADYLAKNVISKALHGMHPEEFKFYMKEYTASGRGDNATRLAVREDALDTQAISTKYSMGLHDIAKAGSYFFDASLRNNQQIANHIAWLKAKDLFTDGAFKPEVMASPRVRAWMSAEVSKLAMSMKSSSAAYWQKGLLAWPTQFLGYMQRELDILAPACLGGDTRWTGAQKFRMAAGQGILFGKYGLPIAGIATGLASAFGVDRDTAEKYTGGLIDSVASSVIGTDISYGSRVGITEAVRHLYKELSEGQFLDVLGGPAAEGTSNWIDQLSAATKMVTANSLEQRPIPTLERLNSVLDIAEKTAINNISSLSQANKAMFLYNYGKYITNSGKVVVSQSDQPNLINNRLAAIAVALSIPPEKAVEANELVETNTESKDTIKELTQSIGQFQEQAIEAAGHGEMAKNAELSDQVQLMMMCLPDNTMQRMNVMRNITTRNVQSLYQQEKQEQFKLQGYKSK